MDQLVHQDTRPNSLEVLDLITFIFLPISTNFTFLVPSKTLLVTLEAILSVYHRCDAGNLAVYEPPTCGPLLAHQLRSPSVFALALFVIVVNPQVIHVARGYPLSCSCGCVSLHLRHVKV